MTPGLGIALPSPAAPARSPLPAWLPVVAGLLLLYVPTYRDIAAVFWDSDQGAYGPVVLAMWLWLVWRERAALRVERPTPLATAVGWAAIVVGSALYALGRSQEMYQLEAGSQLAILPGIALVLLGPKSTKRLWFVWLFLAFTVPLPGSLVDWLLVPMKELVSAAVTDALYFVGLPIARDGVVIYVGHYRLFIADACSGLNGLVALTAIGLLYVHVAGHRSRALGVVLLAAIVPVAFAANVLRVAALVLATYYGGDALGQRLHDYVAFAEIAAAFGAFFALDHVGRAALRVGGRAR